MGRAWPKAMVALLGVNAFTLVLAHPALWDHPDFVVWIAGALISLPMFAVAVWLLDPVLREVWARVRHS